MNTIMLRTLLLALSLLLGAAAFAQQQAPTKVASVILPKAKAINVEAVVENFARRVEETDPELETEQVEGVLQIRVAGGTALLALVPAPIPQQELAQTCKYAWYYWEQACEATVKHEAHVLASLSLPKMSKASASMLLTHLVNAVLETSDAIAVYWGVTLQSREAFLKESAQMSAKNLPVPLWVSVILSKEASGNASISTQGLADYGLMEIEAKDAKMSVQDLYALVMSTAEHLIVSGPVLKDGENIGSDKRRIQVKHAASHWNKGKRVYRLEVR